MVHLFCLYVGYYINTKLKGRDKMTIPNSIMIDGVKYIRADEVPQAAEKLDGLKYVIVRTYSAGVFAGYIESRNGQEVVMKKARRLWYWDGAASLSQLAMEGVKKPQNCKFPCEVERIELLNAIEILDCTEIARNCIQAVQIWQQ